MSVNQFYKVPNVPKKKNHSFTIIINDENINVSQRSYYNRNYSLHIHTDLLLLSFGCAVNLVKSDTYCGSMAQFSGTCMQKKVEF
jgi:hypothetical protein